ncbi:MAG: nodulation protein NfeD [Bacteroidales bacterium]|nr:nodulation protein NfeD [Bacteroidales bacterium]MDD3988538.1 nodulation protein NfeD [Bacteroidales bacterium]
MVSRLIKILLILFTVNIHSLNATGNDKKIYVIEIKTSIDKGSFRILKKGLSEARELASDYVIIHLNTYGGAVDAADSIRTALLNCPVPTVAFIDNQAVSAGALISIACDSIYMKRGGTIGAATVVNQNGEVMPDKYQSFMRAMMRSTAEVNGRNPEIAESMVTDSSKVLSFTLEEAVANGYCEGAADSVEEVASTVSGGENYTISRQKITLLDKIISLFLSPMLQGILLMFIIGGIYFELQSPGIGFPSVIAILAAVLYFSPLYIEGLAENWEIIVFVVGLLLILAELFIIPGFGIAGISGIILSLTGLIFAMVNNDLLYFEGEVNYLLIIKPLAIVLLSFFISITVSIYLAGKYLSGNRFNYLSLKTELNTGEGFSVKNDELESLVGREGVAQTPLLPAGKIEIDGRWYEASMDTGSAKKGDKLLVTRCSGGRLYCERPLL